MDFPLARQHFYQEVHQPDEFIDLAKAALYIAQEEYPDIDPIVYLNQLDTIALGVMERLPQERYPLKILHTINQHLYEDLGFCGNTADYYDPRNSYLNQVLDRRCGIPITLALVYLEVAKRIEFPMAGVGMPGHFLIRPVLDGMQILVDPFHNGEIMFEQDCQNRLNEIYNGTVALNSDHLQVVNPRQFLARLLTNLKLIYLQQQKLGQALAAIERILLLMPEAIQEQRARGLLYYQAGRWAEAAHDLDAYLAQVPQAADGDTIRQLLINIQSYLDR